MIAAAIRRQVSERIAAELGLWFADERWSDLSRLLLAAAPELGFDDLAACCEWLRLEPWDARQGDILAAHLTVGETFFLRETAAFEALSTEILPALVASRRSKQRRLRLWSAGCCTGEEAYSLAIVLAELLPDLADWDIAILATDLNPVFLRRGEAAVYGAWSFRGVPAAIAERYFRPTADGTQLEVMPELRRLVTFAQHNLVTDGSPALAGEPGAIDVVLCRNVLMYFQPEQAAETKDRLADALIDGGWLVVAAVETIAEALGQFEAVNFPGLTVYRKARAAVQDAAPPEAPAAPLAPLPRAPAEPLRRIAARSTAAVLAQQPPPAQPADKTLRAGREADDVAALASQAREQADLGLLPEARSAAARWVAASPLDPGALYLLATVQMEQGEPAAAEDSLRQALYLSPRFVMAHFALANLARAQHQFAAAGKQFRNTLELLSGCRPEDLLPESDGLTAGHLAAMVSALAGGESDALPVE